MLELGRSEPASIALATEPLRSMTNFVDTRPWRPGFPRRPFSEEATRVSAARWIAFGGVLYASKRGGAPAQAARDTARGRTQTGVRRIVP